MTIGPDSSRSFVLRLEGTQGGTQRNITSLSGRYLSRYRASGGHLHCLRKHR